MWASGLDLGGILEVQRQRAGGGIVDCFLKLLHCSSREGRAREGEVVVSVAVLHVKGQAERVPLVVLVECAAGELNIPGVSVVVGHRCRVIVLVEFVGIIERHALLIGKGIGCVFGLVGSSGDSIDIAWATSCSVDCVSFNSNVVVAE